ncbi:MAG: ribosome assembly RNA-binding protein YhbY [Proteobacteria bacterium]|nr:ribosome assembly RNA-binding protein YhbY [Pseudomonadota bacterium]
MQSGLVQKLSPMLKGAQRRQLRGLAHPLKPVVQVGQQGVTEMVIRQLETALYDHELVKVKVINTYAGTIEDAACALASGTGSACVQQIGHILVFYKANPDKPVIELVRASED